ncbi:hypothetical protein B0H14DRAFT_3861635 [Mycena olivaceomarginata]|nr:hypothetical protein B0H14DRAFT_3861635 [Mycena olivaceomarginata]
MASAHPEDWADAMMKEFASLIETGTFDRREDANKLSGSRGSYCFDLDGNEDPADAPDEKNSQPSYSVDALAAGNWTRFVNHCCSPNLQVIPVVFDAMPQDNMPYHALVAVGTSISGESPSPLSVPRALAVASAPPYCAANASKPPRMASPMIFQAFAYPVVCRDLENESVSFVAGLAHVFSGTSLRGDRELSPVSSSLSRCSAFGTSLEGAGKAPVEFLCASWSDPVSRSSTCGTAAS